MSDRAPIEFKAGMPGRSIKAEALLATRYDLKCNPKIRKHYKSGKIKPGDTIEVCLANPKTSETVTIDTITAP